MGTLSLVRLSHQGANAVTVGDKKLQKLRVSISSKLELGKPRYSSKTSPFLGYAQTTIACFAAVPRRTSIACFGRATHKKKY
jgi:hypothetical protein